jgi:hypothetical protein
VEEWVRSRVGGCGYGRVLVLEWMKVVVLVSLVKTRIVRGGWEENAGSGLL